MWGLKWLQKSVSTFQNPTRADLRVLPDPGPLSHRLGHGPDGMASPHQPGPQGRPRSAEAQNQGKRGTPDLLIARGKERQMSHQHTELSRTKREKSPANCFAREI